MKPELVAAIVFGVALAGWVWVMFYQLEKPLLGPHSFRQTQTAISARYMAEDGGMFWNYITPVLGKPWQIPLEVPIFQWVVARVHRLLGAEAGDLEALDKVGRVISALAWLVCVVPVWWIARWLGLGRAGCLLTGALMLSCPLYLFWGRAFLMETTGTLLVCGMVALALWGVERRRWEWLVGAAVLGVAAALCKGTTWAVGAGTAGLLLVFAKGMPRREQWVWTGAGLAAVGVGFLPAKWWVAWADAVKMGNAFARELIVIHSPQQKAWNYGTWEQKLSPMTWEVIFRHVAEGLLVAAPVLGALFLPAVMVAGLVVGRGRLLPMGLLLAGFAAGPVVFTNLYFEHSYYWTANGVWWLLAVGVALAGVAEEPKWGSWAAVGLGAAAVVFGLWNWQERYRPVLDALPTREQLAEAWTRPVQAVVPPGRTLLIVGNDWNPNALYYADRKGIAFPTHQKIPFPGPQLEESLRLLDGEERLGAVVVNPALLEQHGAVFEGFLRERGFELQGRPTAFGVLFVAK